MAINSITFGGVNSADYGIYISGEGVFDAPKREVEMVSIPGRNGDLCIDHGRFENIEVTYPAFNYEAEYDDFVQNLADFRNAISSQKGYQRLSDTFHPDEYRMATFIDGLEIEPIKYNTASEFNIVFNCKPQRYLTSGETSVSVDSGDTLTNPTRFESSPLLEIEGHGGITLNDYNISLTDGEVGYVVLAENVPRSSSETVILPMGLVGDTDSIGVSGFDFIIAFTYANAGTNPITDITVAGDDVTLDYKLNDTGDKATAYIHVDDFSMSKNDSKRVVAGLRLQLTNSPGTYAWATGCDFVMSPDRGLFCQIWVGASDVISLNDRSYYVGKIDCVSTAPILGHPTYIDCDLGIAYRIDNEEVTSLDAYIDLGSDLPTLAPGGNEVTYDNTITDLKIVPRYWKI